MWAWDGGRRLQVTESFVEKDERIERGTGAGTVRGTWPARDEVEIRRDITDAPLTKSDVERAYKAAGYEWTLLDVVKREGVIFAIVEKDGGYAAIPASVVGSQYDAVTFNLEDMVSLEGPAMVDGAQAFGQPDDDKVQSEPGKNPADGRGVYYRPTPFAGTHSGGGFSPTKPMNKIIKDAWTAEEANEDPERGTSFNAPQRAAIKKALDEAKALAKDQPKDTRTSADLLADFNATNKRNRLFP